MIAFAKHTETAWLVLILSVFFFANALAQSEESPENYAPRDTVFEEIILTEEGVTAIDTAGYEWYYDFEYSMFVAGTPPPPEDGLDLPPDPGFEYTGMPIEERATIRKNVKHFEMGSVTVRADEFVEGDIKALDMVTIKGWVQGDVVSIRDRVLITETGQVDGNVTAPKVILKDGGVVQGEILESEVPIDMEDFTAGFSHEFLLVMVIITLSLLFVGFILLALMPRQVVNIESCIMRHKKRSFFLGLLLLLVMPAIVVLIAITIVGIVLIPLLPLVYIWAIILGYVATGRGIMTPIYNKYLGAKASPMLLGVLGILALMSPWIITSIQMGSESSVSQAFGVALLVISIIITTFPIFAGIGAAFLTRFGFRSYASATHYGPQSSPSTIHTPAPPPIPPLPPIPDSPIPHKEETPRPGPRIPE